MDHVSYDTLFPEEIWAELDLTRPQPLPRQFKGQKSKSGYMLMSSVISITNREPTETHTQKPDEQNDAETTSVNTKGRIQRMSDSAAQATSPAIHREDSKKREPRDELNNETTTHAEPQRSQPRKQNDDQELYAEKSPKNAMGERTELSDVVSQLKMETYRHTKLTLQDVLNIGQETMTNIKLMTVEDIPWNFLQKVMALNVIARSTTLIPSAESRGINRLQSFTVDLEIDSSDSLHPLDVMCALLHCSDHFLQQEIVSKMSMCQFAVPLLLPAGDGTYCTLMLWAMRDIVKRWRPHSLADSKGFMEDNVVNVPMPTFSFVRLGKTKLSKSKILNHVLCPTHSIFNIFLNREMDCGNYPRKASDGLVEISWFFPGGSRSSETFPEPFAVTNLHGDLASNLREFTFLTQVSAAVFIFINSFTERDYKLFTKLRDTATKYCFILNSSNDNKKTQTTLEKLKQLSQTLTVLLVKTRERNAINSVNDIQEIISDCLKDKVNSLSLEDMAAVASKHGIKVDENTVECQKARNHALSIIREIKNVSQYKTETMRLQGDLWKEISKEERELCRMKNQGSSNSTLYRNKLTKRCFDLTRSQYQNPMPDGIKTFITALSSLTQQEKKCFMKWMKFYLDSAARGNLLALQTKYRRSIANEVPNTTEMKQISQNISENSLGIENFLREIAQFYEAECAMIRQEQINPNQRKFTELPRIAANLLLDGFPLELIDGDASNIPMQWITDILAELDTKTGGQCRMRVITVLGVQSTGKSTLLNTMFGLQFPVASGRCTRGAFMTLIRVEEDFTEELGCDFILVIDTEGLKAPELASLENSYEHDNELATLVVGLSDITIINMAMENTSEMKDILQIVVHAFLRMSEVGKKPNCHLVHQNVGDVAAHQNNEAGRAKLFKELDEMTQVAARMERRNKSIKFSDIIDYDSEKHSWYIPGLWQGVPPMAPINQGYSENVFKLKKYIFDSLKERQSPGPQSASSFIEWLKSLWNAVKHESFIFSFRNVLVAEAYDQLSVKYSELEWKFRKQVHSYVAKSENVIKNQISDNLQPVTSDIVNNDLKDMLNQEEANMTKQLSHFFKSGCANVHLVERYREDFLIHVKSLRKDLEVMASSKFWETLQIQSGKREIQNIQNTFHQSIENKVHNRLKSMKMNQRTLSETELKLEFDALWDSILVELNVTRLRIHRIDAEMLEQMRRELSNRPGAVQEILNNVTSLKNYGKGRFAMDKTYLDSNYFLKRIKEFFTKDRYKKLENIAQSLADNCNYYVMEKIRTNEDYNELYCQALLTIINTTLDEEEIRKLHPTPQFEVNLKLHILGKAAPLFQKMHDDFGLNNDPKRLISKFKSQYFSVFKNKVQGGDISRSHAKGFCEQCLKPAIVEHIYRNLGKEIGDEILRSVDATMFRSQKHFQFALLKELLQTNRFENYLQYITQYESYARRWISEYITKKYKSVESLDNLISKILSSISEKVRAALRGPKVQNSQSVSELLQIVSNELTSHLVLSKNAMNITDFQNMTNVKQFSKDIEIFVNTMDNEIKSSIQSMDIESIFLNLTLKPHDELFQRVIGCGKKCPFCEVPCESGGTKHYNHSATIHRPKGLAQYTWSESNVLCNSTCSTDILSNGSFTNPDTDGKWHPYKEYQIIYPDWIIHPDKDLNSSDFWNFVLKQFNHQFAKYYNANPAEIPPEWEKITQQQALRIWLGSLIFR
uniref:VLIG-type G domain-containing protein n=1 Tax=Leptobrachium leishanense TaxID=445787 RepID=A0A8C5Q0B0_9ANUR